MNPAMRVRAHTADAPLRNPRVLFAELLADAPAIRELALRLVIRDVTAQYRQTLLGLAWVFIVPVATTATWLLLNGSGLVAVGATPVPYAVFVLAGTSLWAVFADAVAAPLQHTAAAKTMLVRVNFPREALILAGVYHTLFNAAVRLTLVCVALALLGVTPGPGVLLLPLAVVVLVAAGTALGLLLTPMGMLYEDVHRGMPLALQLMMYLTPVVFPLPAAGAASTLLRLNPVTPLVVTSRELLTGQPLTLVPEFLLVTSATALALLALWLLYRLAMPIVTERIGA